MASRLIFKRRRLQGINIIFVSIRPRPRPRPKPQPAPESRDFIASLTLEQCNTIAEIVAQELKRRQLWRAEVGDPVYCAVEAAVVHDIINREIDLSEVAGKIEEARWEAQYLEAA